MPATCSGASATAAAERERVVPDFLIGHTPCCNATRLITRDAGFFRDYFKGLKVIVPKA